MAIIDTHLRYLTLLSKLQQYLLGKLILKLRKVPPRVPKVTDARTDLVGWIERIIFELNLAELDKTEIVAEPLTEYDLDPISQSEFAAYLCAVTDIFQNMWMDTYKLLLDNHVDLKTRDINRCLFGTVSDTLMRLKTKKA